MGEFALSDEVTARLYELSVRQARVRVFVTAFVAAVYAATVWVLITATREFATSFLVVGSAVLLVVASAVALSRARASHPAGGWTLRPAPRRLLAEQSWRETPAKVLNVRGTVLVLPDGLHVRVHGLPAAAREVAVRAGRVWLVGPDAAGRLAVRVDGSHTPWPARRIAPRPGTAALSIDEATAAVSTRRADPVARGVVLWAFSVSVTANFVMASEPEGSWRDVVMPFTYGLFGVVCGVGLRRPRR